MVSTILKLGSPTSVQHPILRSVRKRGFLLQVHGATVCAEVSLTTCAVTVFSISSFCQPHLAWVSLEGFLPLRLLCKCDLACIPPSLVDLFLIVLCDASVNSCWTLSPQVFCCSDLRCGANLLYHVNHILFSTVFRTTMRLAVSTEQSDNGGSAFWTILQGLSKVQGLFRIKSSSAANNKPKGKHRKTLNFRSKFGVGIGDGGEGSRCVKTSRTCPKLRCGVQRETREFCLRIAWQCWKVPHEAKNWNVFFLRWHFQRGKCHGSIHHSGTATLVFHRRFSTRFKSRLQ